MFDKPWPAARGRPSGVFLCNFLHRSVVYVSRYKQDTEVSNTRELSRAQLINSYSQHETLLRGIKFVKFTFSEDLWKNLNVVCATLWSLKRCIGITVGCDDRYAVAYTHEVDNDGPNIVHIHEIATGHTSTWKLASYITWNVNAMLITVLKERKESIIYPPFSLSRIYIYCSSRMELESSTSIICYPRESGKIAT
jgi:hypothetical protein